MIDVRTEDGAPLQFFLFAATDADPDPNSVELTPVERFTGVPEQYLLHVLPTGGKALPDRVVESVWGFFSVYVALFIIIMLALMFTGLDQVTAFSSVIACMNNLGPGLGKVSSNFASLNPIAKWALSLAMILGRLEIFTLLVLFTPTFWRR